MEQILQFIFMNLLMVSAGTIIVLFMRALPRVGDEEPVRTNVIERFVTSEIPEKLDEAFNTISSKFLRKLRVLVLKLDNAIHRALSRIKSQKEENGNGTRNLFEVQGGTARSDGASEVAPHDHNRLV